MAADATRVLVLGASGLIGNFVAADLARRGFSVIAAARRFTPAQLNLFGGNARAAPLVELDVAALARLLQESDADVVLNCVGVLQDSANDDTRAVHAAFVERLIAAMRAAKRPILLVHVSIPGTAEDDRTAFASSKRAAERAIIQSGVAYAILRPGFVLAPAAYGGSALLRAVAASPFDLPAALAARPFAVVAAEDVAETVAVLAQRWRGPDRGEAACWELMVPDTRSLGDAVVSLRAWLGNSWLWHIPVPGLLLTLAAWAGDLAAWLGWRPPIRSTTLRELQRGVTGDPGAWMAATGIAPLQLDDILRAHPVTVQEKWFARLYPLKALIVAGLVIFWCASALIALTVAYPAAVAILTTRGYPDAEAQLMTVAGSVMDFGIGLAIAFRRTCPFGLIAGIAASLFYMVGAAVLTPDLWIEPLGALVKTFPAIILMLVALAIVDDR
jgi:uncharacterized protein YbjT (DUF2867 family)